MKTVQHIEFHTGSKEELLPDFADDFPYIATRAELDKYHILELILKAFQFPADGFGYEMKMRNALSEIWLLLFELAKPLLDQGGEVNRNNDKIKLMMVYIHEHYPEKI